MLMSIYHKARAGRACHEVVAPAVSPA